MLLGKKAFLRLKKALLAIGVSFISNWFEAQIKFTWGFVNVYLSLTPDSNEAQFDFFHVLQMNHKGLRVYALHNSSTYAVCSRPCPCHRYHQGGNQGR